MKYFRTLTPDEIECRIAQAKENGVSILLYKTARTDADLLDEVIGPDKWQNDFKLVDGVLYGGLGVDYGNGMVWKWDAGTESNTEAEKGRASDAFKRAGFKHGIGRELYSSPFIWIKADKLKKLTESKYRKDKYGNPVWECGDKFTVAAISYDDKEKVSYLAIRNQNSECVFDWGEAPDSRNPTLTCEECLRTIVEVKTKKGTISANDVAQRTWKKYGRFLCHECAAKLAKAEEEMKEESDRSGTYGASLNE